MDAEARGGALWFPRMLQGNGRHDAPQRYGCLYVSEEPLSTVVEQLAPFVGTKLAAPDLVRGGLPLALAALELPDGTRAAQPGRAARPGGGGAATVSPGHA